MRSGSLGGSGSSTITDKIRVSPFVLTWPRLLGLSLHEVARAAGIPYAELESRAELSYDETLAIWRALEALTNDPVVGLHAGMLFRVDQMGVVGPALAHATHLDAAIDVLARIMSAFARNAGIRRVETEHGAGLEYRMPTLRSRHGVDTIFAATVALARYCTGSVAPAQPGRVLVPLAVDHQMPPERPAEYARFFGVTPTWHAASCRLVFRAADLSLPFVGASPALALLLTENAPRLLGSATAARTFEQDFERAFWAAHHEGEATLETTAKALAVSPRTLQRRLQGLDRSFVDERARVLARRATALLKDASVPVETVAERLGYGSRASFERAFLRWTGKTPSAARATE